MGLEAGEEVGEASDHDRFEDLRGAPNQFGLCILVVQIRSVHLCSWYSSKIARYKVSTDFLEKK